MNTIAKDRDAAPVLSPSLSTGCAAGPSPRTGRHILICAVTAIWRGVRNCGADFAATSWPRLRRHSHECSPSGCDTAVQAVARASNKRKCNKIASFRGLGQTPRPSAASQPHRFMNRPPPILIRLLKTCTYCQCLRRLPEFLGTSLMPSKLRQAGICPVATSRSCPDRRIRSPVGASARGRKGALCARTIRAPRSSWPDHPTPGRSATRRFSIEPSPVDAVRSLCGLGHMGTANGVNLADRHRVIAYVASPRQDKPAHRARPHPSTDIRPLSTARCHQHAAGRCGCS